MKTARAATREETTETARAATREQRRKPPGRLPGKKRRKPPGGSRAATRAEEKRQETVRGGYQEETAWANPRVVPGQNTPWVETERHGHVKPSLRYTACTEAAEYEAEQEVKKKSMTQKKDRDIEMKGKPGKGQKGVKAPVMPPQPKKEEAKVEEIKTIVIPEVITIKELADKMKLQPSAIVKKLFLQGTIVTINQEIDFEKAEEIAMEYDVLCEKEKKVNVIEELLKEEEEGREGHGSETAGHLRNGSC